MVKNLVKTRLPTAFGEFSLYLFSEAGKEHLALVKSTVSGLEDVPVRVHSECLTGDVFGSRRCDCGDQLRHTLQYLGRIPCGILIYLRQEGRGIGLRKKLEAYNLQDEGMDTVEANLSLGHQADERDYGIAARILRELKTSSIRLITNNPHKVDELTTHGVRVSARMPIEVGQNEDNLGYLRSKAEKMAHLLTFRSQLPMDTDLSFMQPLLDQLSFAQGGIEERPFVTLSYAQSLDGSIAFEGGSPCALSSEAALTLTHFLRSRHDALLVGVNTVLADDPRLNVRYCEGRNPRAVIIDSTLRTPLDCRLWEHASEPPIIVATEGADPERRAALIAKGARIIEVSAEYDGSVNVRETVAALRAEGIRTLMVEGGARIISTFLKLALVDYCVITITPKILGGLRAIDGLSRPGRAAPLSLSECTFHPLGTDIIAYGPITYP